MAETDALAALGAGGQEDLGRRAVRVLLEKVVLHRPHAVEAETVGELDLVERLAEQPLLGAGIPGARQLKLVEEAEFHGAAVASAGP